MVPMQDPDAAAAELKAIQDQGLHGVEIASNVLGDLDRRRAVPAVLHEAQRLDLAVFVHAMPTPVRAASAGGDGHLRRGRRGCLRGRVDGVRRHRRRLPGPADLLQPRGRGLPRSCCPARSTSGAASWNEEPVDLTRAVMHDDGPSPLELARRFWYDSMVFDRRAIRFLIDLLGSDRLLVGSDFPAMLREEPAGRTLRSMDLAPQAWEDISGANAFRWLGIDPPV